MKALMIRHAEASGQGPEAPLTPLGEALSEALAPELAKLGGGPLYASPFRRALATIEPYATKTGQVVQVLAGLRERLLAPKPPEDWMGHIARSFEDAGYALPGGESFEDLRKRAGADLLAVQRRGGPRPVLVSHGNLMAALFRDADRGFGFADWEALRNPDLFEVTLDVGRVASFSRVELPFRVD